MTVDLAVWLRAQLDADEQVARAATPGPWEPEHDEVVAPELYDHFGDTRFTVAETCGPDTLAEARYIALHDPAFVLADIAAKRAVLNLHRHNFVRPPQCMTCASDLVDDGAGVGAYIVGETYPCLTLRLLAQPYAGRPGWREEWEQ